ncbi:hypothetical protein CR513_22257, partial [Mucuna pruriens]
MSAITLKSGKEQPQQQIINMHYEFHNFDDFTNCDCTCTGLTECLIYTEISSVINVSVGVVDIASGNIVGVVKVLAIQPTLPSIVQPLQPLIIIVNKLQAEQKERLLQDLKKLEDFYEHLVKHSTLRLLLKKPLEDVRYFGDFTHFDFGDFFDHKFPIYSLSSS